MVHAFDDIAVLTLNLLWVEFWPALIVLYAGLVRAGGPTIDAARRQLRTCLQAGARGTVSNSNIGAAVTTIARGCVKDASSVMFAAASRSILSSSSTSSSKTCTVNYTGTGESAGWKL